MNADSGEADALEAEATEEDTLALDLEIEDIEADLDRIEEITLVMKGALNAVSQDILREIALK